ncbi:MAG: hypothetical protein LBE09_08785, partial [Christensenellaceae bacterium]|nr:hypothetical protein [Christensenellaceae bacterium]
MYTKLHLLRHKSCTVAKPIKLSFLALLIIISFGLIFLISAISLKDNISSVLYNLGITSIQNESDVAHA